MEAEDEDDKLALDELRIIGLFQGYLAHRRGKRAVLPSVAVGYQMYNTGHCCNYNVALHGVILRAHRSTACRGVNSDFCLSSSWNHQPIADVRRYRRICACRISAQTTFYQQPVQIENLISFSRTRL